MKKLNQCSAISGQVLPVRAGGRSIRHSSFVIRHFPRAFTLIEIMVVVGIMALVMAMALPSLYQTLHPDSLPQAVDAIMEACTTARGRAILEGVDTELVIRPLDHTLEVRTAGPSESGPTCSVAEGESPAPAPPPTRGGAGGMSGRISDRIVIEAMLVHGRDCTEEEEARVRFHPNGVCYEFKILLRKDAELRLISLEVVTAMATVTSDPKKILIRGR